jgi:predicted ATPase
MLNSIELQNFKAARHLPIPLSPLTVLAGLNGSGKSSVLQAIALLKQSLHSGVQIPELSLRGPLIRLGRSEDVLFEDANGNEIGISVTTPNGTTKISAPAVNGADTLHVRIEGDINDVISQLENGFQFIQADRITPAPHYVQAGTRERDVGWLGCKGEYTADFLARNGEKLKVSSGRLYSCTSTALPLDLAKQIAPTDLLLDQVAGWLQYLSPGIRPRVEPLDLADAAALQYTYSGRSLLSESRKHRSANVGFGLTYCLPIVVACLAAPAGSLLLLENPEAHLHPRGQAALGQLLALCMADGVQIIVETHSDHVLNGIRVAVKNIPRVKCDEIALHYFTRDVDTWETRIVSPQIGPDGQLDQWPEGFFDQWDLDLDALLS